jgi:hypothetical protein
MCSQAFGFTLFKLVPNEIGHIHVMYHFACIGRKAACCHASEARIERERLHREKNYLNNPSRAPSHGSFSPIYIFPYLYWSLLVLREFFYRTRVLI